jgi:hypothetical protein
MSRLLPLCVAFLALPVAAAAADSSASRLDAVRDAYFSRDWARATVDVPPVAAVAPSKLPDNPVGADHAQVAHMYITRQAYEIYAAQFSGGELARYIGEYENTRPKVRDDGNVVAGSFDEDEAHYTPFDETMPSNRHFWNYHGGLHAGLGGFDSSVNRVHKYLTGGYGVDGDYDESWSDNQGQRRGVRGHGAVYLYQHGEKAKAYWYLGHMVHLLEDLTVPAHAHLFAHVVPWMDAYETYMKEAHVRWPVDTSKPIESFPTMLELFRATAEVTDRYDAGNGSGIFGGVDGSADRGHRRRGGFTKAKLDEEGSVLMPLAFNRAAALYLFFYKQVDKTPPTVILTSPDGRSAQAPARAIGPEVMLAASASDDASGVDRRGFLFFTSYWDGAAWTPWAPVSSRPGTGAESLVAAPGLLYRVKATARDAAGNVGESEPSYLRIDGPTDGRRTVPEVRRPGRSAPRSAAAR